MHDQNENIMMNHLSGQILNLILRSHTWNNGKSKEKAHKSLTNVAPGLLEWIRKERVYLIEMFKIMKISNEENEEKCFQCLRKNLSHIMRG